MDVSELYQGGQPVDKDDLQLEINLWELATGQLPTDKQIEAMAKDLVAKAKKELSPPHGDASTLSLTRSAHRRLSSLKRA